MPPEVTPLDRVIATAGGIKRLCGLAERGRTAIYRWRQPVTKGGCGGMVPLSAQRTIVGNAQRAGVPLTFSDFAARDGEVLR